MKNCLYILLLLTLFGSCTGKEKENIAPLNRLQIDTDNKENAAEADQLTTDTNIDGYYIDRKFGVCEIYTQNGTTYMVIPHRYSDNSTTFKLLEKNIENNILHLEFIDTSSLNSDLIYNCAIHIDNNEIYLDKWERIRIEENGNVYWKNKLTIKNEFRKYDIEYDEEKYNAINRLSWFANWPHYVHYSIFIITPKYPIMEIALLKLDDDFYITDIDIGEILYEDSELYAHFNDTVLSLKDDLKFNFNNFLEFCTFPRSQTTGNVIYPNIGDRVITGKQHFESMTIKKEGFNIETVAEEYSDTLLITTTRTV